MAYLCLEGSELIRGFEFGQDERFQAHLSDETRQLMVLYPGARATMASADNAEKLRASFEDRPATVLVIDGTWPQAKKMFHGTPELQTLPWLAFETERRSEYQFRLQPDPLCLSTIEAVHELIDAFARHGVCQPTPSGAHDNLLTVFRFMNEVQVRYMNDPNVPGYRRRPHRPMSEIPTAKRWERRRLLFRPAAEPE